MTLATSREPRWAATARCTAEPLGRGSRTSATSGTATDARGRGARARGCPHPVDPLAHARATRAGARKHGSYRFPRRQVMTSTAQGDATFAEGMDVAADVGRLWWLWLVTGVAWVVAAL